jgi:MFS family permease
VNVQTLLNITKTNIRNLTILLGSTTTVLAAAVLAPALPGMALAFQDVANADFLVRLTLTMPALFIALGAPFAGFLLDRWGRKPVLIAALILYSLAGASGFFVDSLMGILVGRALLGLAVAGVMSGFTTLIFDYSSGPGLDQFLGYQAAFIGLGGMVFLLIAGFLADIGWQFPFLIYLFGLVILPGVIFAIDEPQIQAIARRQDTPDEKSSFPLKTITFIYGIAFVGMLVFFTFPVQVPFYLTTQAGASNSQVGLALSLQTLSSVVIALQFQRLKARLSIQGIFSLIFLTLGINHVIIALTPNYGLVVVGLLIGGLGLGLFPPTVNAWLALVTPPALRGRAVGGLTAALFLGQFFTPIVTQPVVQQVGMGGTFGVIGLVSLLLSMVFVGTAVIGSNKPVTQGNINSGE